MLIYAAGIKNPNSPTIEDAALWFENHEILYAGKRSGLPAACPQTNTMDLGDCCIYPGLVNAHAHLELTALEGFGYPGDFVAWVRKIIAAKNDLDLEEQNQKMQHGIVQSILGGATCIGDHVSVNGPLEILLNSPLRGKAFLEILGVKDSVAQDIFEMAKYLQDEFAETSTRFEIIPSPHSLHALNPDILEKILQGPGPYSIHLAESQAEQEYFYSGSGEFQKLISERGQSLVRPASSAIRELEQRRLLNSNILLIHGNYLKDDEIALLADRRISIVHCPYSHGYFGHQDFPIEKILGSGVNVALGSDSLASASTLSMLEILREMKRKFPWLSLEQIFSMATLGGAKALNLGDEIGTLATGKKADLIATPWRSGQDTLEVLFASQEPAFAIIDGELVLEIRERSIL